MAAEQYDACVSWITEMLSFYQSRGGDVAAGLYLEFLEYDALIKSQNGRGIIFRIHDLEKWNGNSDFSFKVPGCGGATGVCGAFRDPTISIREDMISGGVNGAKAALFGHEFTHLFQGDLYAFSATGEAAAYYVEYFLRNEFGVEQSARTNYFHEAISNSRGVIGIHEATEFRDELRSSFGYSTFLPRWPLVPDPRRFWDHDSGQNHQFFALVTDPARHFAVRGQTFRQIIDRIQ